MQNKELLALIARVDKATTAIGEDVSAVATKIDALVAKITTSMTAAEVTEITDKFSVQVERLEAAGENLDALGKDPEDPVPVASRKKGK